MLDLCIYGCYKMTDEGLIGFKRGSCLCRLNTSGCYKITDSGTRYLIQVLQLPHTCIAATSCSIALPICQLMQVLHCLIQILHCLTQYCAASSSIALPHPVLRCLIQILHCLVQYCIVLQRLQARGAASCTSAHIHGRPSAHILGRPSAHILGRPSAHIHGRPSAHTQPFTLRARRPVVSK